VAGHQGIANAREHIGNGVSHHTRHSLPTGLLDPWQFAL
jgi:hypothetical protein